MVCLVACNYCGSVDVVYSEDFRAGSYGGYVTCNKCKKNLQLPLRLVKVYTEDGMDVPDDFSNIDLMNAIKHKKAIKCKSFGTYWKVYKIKEMFYEAKKQPFCSQI